jgi:hypothetical protein
MDAVEEEGEDEEFWRVEKHSCVSSRLEKTVGRRSLLATPETELIEC